MLLSKYFKQFDKMYNQYEREYISGGKQRFLPNSYEMFCQLMAAMRYIDSLRVRGIENSDEQMDMLTKMVFIIGEIPLRMGLSLDDIACYLCEYVQTGTVSISDLEQMHRDFEKTEGAKVGLFAHLEAAVIADAFMGAHNNGVSEGYGEMLYRGLKKDGDYNTQDAIKSLDSDNK